MCARLDELRNVGPSTARRLRAAGLHGPDDLRCVGAAAAFAAVRGEHPQHTSLNLLWALEGALRDRDWRDLSETEKHRLLDEVDALGT